MATSSSACAWKKSRARSRRARRRTPRAADGGRLGAWIGVGRWTLRLPACDSLKQKRSVVRSLRDRLRARHKVSVAETDFQDEHRRAELTAVFVASDPGVAESMLGRLDDAVCSDPRVYIAERNVSIHRPDGLD